MAYQNLESAPLPLPGPLVGRTRNVGERGIGVRADKLDCANDDNDNHCQHHAVLGNVLCLVLEPSSAKKWGQCPPPMGAL